MRDAQTDLQTWRKSPLRPLLDRIRKQIPDDELEKVREGLDEAKATLLESKPVQELVDALNERLAALAGPVQTVTTELDFAPSEPDQFFRSLRVFIQEHTTKPITDASLDPSQGVNPLIATLSVRDMPGPMTEHPCSGFLRSSGKEPRRRCATDERGLFSRRRLSG
ncbi:MAG: hypothetical protein Q7T82_11190 [Armatimonadota bacterium]|nr:hypothetical protein [Armatimonadota bacterium]